MVDIKIVDKNYSLSRKRNNHTKSCHWTLFFLLLLLTTNATAQTKIPDVKREQRVGLNLGYSRQDSFPFNDQDYAHITRSIKIQLAQEIWREKNTSLEILIEPSIYFVNHQLLNLFFIKPSADNFEQRRELFTQNRSYKEYALNIGLTYNYIIKDNLTAYGLISIGPMTATADTERQKKGFSFSDILGAGIRYDLDRFQLDVRASLRHVSNANLRKPNNGHNSAGIEVGFSYRL